MILSIFCNEKEIGSYSFSKLEDLKKYLLKCGFNNKNIKDIFKREIYLNNCTYTLKRNGTI